MNQSGAIDLCRRIEEVAPKFGWHVALTGGCLYKTGERKDADIVFYRIRQCNFPDRAGLQTALKGIGMQTFETYGGGWITKAMWLGENVDLLFPEAPGDHYV